MARAARRHCWPAHSGQGHAQGAAPSRGTEGLEPPQAALDGRQGHAGACRQRLQAGVEPSVIAEHVHHDAAELRGVLTELARATVQMELGAELRPLLAIEPHARAFAEHGRSRHRAIRLERVPRSSRGPSIRVVSVNMV